MVPRLHVLSVWTVSSHLAFFLKNGLAATSEQLYCKSPPQSKLECGEFQVCIDRVGGAGGLGGGRCHAAKDGFFGDDVAAVDAASSSHFVPLSAMMRNHKVSDRPVPGGERKGPECESPTTTTLIIDNTPSSVQPWFTRRGVPI